MAEQMGFKSSMFGFDKKMVMDYIYKLGEEARRQEETYNAKLSQLERDRDAVARRAGEAETQLQEMTAQLQEEKSAASEAAKMIQSLSDEIERQKRISSEKEREIQIQNERCRQLQFRAESLESRSRKYEELSRNVGEILLAAQSSAEEIVAKAREEADGIAQSVTRATIQFDEEYRQVKEGLALMKEGVMAAFDAMDKRLEALDAALAEATGDEQSQPQEGDGSPAEPAAEQAAGEPFDNLVKEVVQEKPAEQPSFFRPASQD